MRDANNLRILSKLKIAKPSSEFNQDIDKFQNPISKRLQTKVDYYYKPYAPSKVDPFGTKTIYTD